MMFWLHWGRESGTSSRNIYISVKKMWDLKFSKTPNNFHSSYKLFEIPFDSRVLQSSDSLYTLY
jgi:hypothetical protein